MKISALKNIFCSFLLVFAATGQVKATERDPAAEGEAGRRSYAAARNSSLFVLSLDLRSYKYEEPGFVEHGGLMYGAYGRFESALDYGSIAVEGSLHYGKLTYKGALCDTGTGICTPYETSNQTDIISRTVGLFYLPMTGAMSIGAGLGLRYLKDTVSEKGFYDRIGTWAFLPIAAKIDVPLAPQVRGVFELEYDYVFYGGIRSNLSQVSSSFEDIYLTQSGYGLNLNMGAVYADVYHAGLYYQTWNLNESDTAQTGGLTVQEPKNNSVSIGIKLGYDFL